MIESDALGFQTFAAGELAEAAAREGDTESLSYISTWMQVRAAATPTEWALGMSARIEALEAEDTDAEALYQESIVHFGKTQLRIELARSQLLYGEWLRRERRHLDARVELRAALRLFREFGVEAFGEPSLNRARSDRRTHPPAGSGYSTPAHPAGIPGRPVCSARPH